MGFARGWFGTSPRLSQVLIDGVFFGAWHASRMCIGFDERFAAV